MKIFNDAAVGQGVLQAAEENAAWILKTASIEVVWMPCRPVSRSDMAICKAPPGALEMHILPHPLTSDVHEDTLGFAILRMSAGDHGAVFLSRVREAAARNSGEIAVADVLGCAIAHEIGHLLLRSGTHSSEGVMRADLRPDDLRRAAQRRLTFTPEQRDRIRRNKQVPQE